jgi:hypothetical protein
LHHGAPGSESAGLLSAGRRSVFCGLFSFLQQAGEMANRDFLIVRDESGERRSPQKRKQDWRKMGRGPSVIGERGINRRSRLPVWKAAMDDGRRMMPVVLGAEIVLEGDTQLALQDKIILIDNIGDGCQYKEWDQEDQDRCPICLHTCGQPL